MREIKFRAWVPKDESRIFANQESYMAVQGTSDNETLQSFMFHYGDEPLLMQYTGLKDKNGKEIYEGDIVTYSTKSKRNPQETGTVVFRDASFIVDLKRSDWNEIMPHAEVIGNIYQNPELIK